MRIAHINPSFYPATYYGGPTESGRALVRALAGRGADVRVLTTDANGPRERLAVETGVEREVDGYRLEYARRVLPESVAPALLWKIQERVAWADVVHLTAVYNFTTFPALAAARAFRKPVIWTPRGGLLRWDHSRRVEAKAAWDRAAGWLAPRALGLHVTSEREAEAARRAYPRARVFVIPNGVEVPAEAPHRPDSRLRLVFVGRIDPIKGLETVLGAVEGRAELAGRGWVLRIAGAGEAAYQAKLTAGLSAETRARVEWLGDVRGAAKAALFADSDLFVFPSHSENFGMAAAEALAHGLPVVASQGTPWSGLDARGAGRWVPGTPEAFRGAIEALAAGDLRGAGQRGRAWMRDEFSWDSVAERFLSAAASLAAR